MAATCRAGAVRTTASSTKPPDARRAHSRRLRDRQAQDRARLRRVEQGGRFVRIPRILGASPTGADDQAGVGGQRSGIQGDHRRRGVVRSAPGIRGIAHGPAGDRRAVRRGALERARRAARHGSGPERRARGDRWDRQREERRPTRDPHPAGMMCSLCTMHIVHVDLWTRGKTAVASAQHYRRRTAMRVGIGYDSHRFAAGRKLILGGVEIAHPLGLAGHSDADAVAHALTDAVLGAAGLGDIGTMFPDSEPRWRGADSLELLKQAYRAVLAAGHRLAQADVTVIAEQPKIGPHVTQMRERLAGSLSVAPDAISVKRETNEGMGWIGRAEGIAVIAVAVLEGPISSPRSNPSRPARSTR